MKLCSHWDLDGVVSEIVLTTFINFDKTYACGYSKFDKFIDTINKDEGVIFSDVALTHVQVEKVASITNRFSIIDHHPTTEALAEKYKNTGDYQTKIFFDSTKCGALLCKETMRKFFPDKFEKIWTKDLEELVQLANVYDLWKNDHEDWQRAYNLNLLFWKYGYYQFRSKFENGYNLRPEDLTAIKQMLKDKGKMYAEAEQHDVGNRCLVVFCDREIVNDIPLIHKRKYDYYFMISANNGRLDVGVRSTKPDADITGSLQEAAEYCENVTSAGGHPLAGGITFKDKVTVADVTDVCELVIKDILGITPLHDNELLKDIYVDDIPF